MRALTKFAAAAAVALTFSALSAPVNAASLIQFGSASPTDAPSMVWTPGAGVGGTLTGVGTVSWNFFETLTQVTGLNPLDAAFAFSATSANGYACNGSVCGIDGLNGSFSFTYSGAAPKNYTWFGGARVLNPGDLILGVTFQNSWIQGTGSSGSVNISTVSATVPGIVTSATSDIFNFSSTNDFDFSFALSGGSNGNNTFTAAPGGTFAAFDANSAGAFAAGAIPEPGTWALMILGFGGAGAMLRSRRRSLALTA